jgi:uncharacterized protein (DUF1499 family)
MSVFDKFKIEKLLNKFNQDQKNERDKLTELSVKYRSTRGADSSAHSFYINNNSNILNNFTNQFQIGNNEPLNMMSKANQSRMGSSNWSINRMKSNENIFQVNGTSTPSFISALFQASSSSSSKSRENNSYIAQTHQTSELSKIGYLLKKSCHTRVRTWLRRKCKTENGAFFIFHSDVRPSIILNNPSFETILIFFNLKGEPRACQTQSNNL